MSIALSNRVKELEAQVATLARFDLEEICFQVVNQREHIRKLQERLAALENRPQPEVVQSVDIYPSNWGKTSAAQAIPAKRKPGRPTKHGQ